MPLAAFTSPSDVRLITFRGKIFKIKVISDDIQPFHEENFSTEVEEVLRAFLHSQWRKTRKKFINKVQTECFLCDITEARWKAAEVLKFRTTKHVFEAYPYQIQFTIKPKASREVPSRTDDNSARKRTSNSACNIPAKIPKNAEKSNHFLTVDLGRPVDFKDHPPESGRTRAKQQQQEIRGDRVVSHQIEENLPSVKNSNHGNIQSKRVMSSSHKGKKVSGKIGQSDQSDHEKLIEDHVMDTDVYNDGMMESLNSNNNNVVTEKKKRSTSTATTTTTESQESTVVTAGDGQRRWLRSHSKSCDRKSGNLPPPLRNVQAYTRDRALIQQEDLAEEMKLQQLSSPLETEKLSRQARASILRTAMEMILTPVKLLFKSK